MAAAGKKKTKKGQQKPTASLILKYTKTFGQNAIDLYNNTGRTAQEWQERLMKAILAQNREGLWVHTKFGYSVPRRNGKNEIVAIREMYALATGEHVLHTAHRTTTFLTGRLMIWINQCKKQNNQCNPCFLFSKGYSYYTVYVLHIWRILNENIVFQLNWKLPVCGQVLGRRVFIYSQADQTGDLNHMEKRVKWYVGLSYFVFWFMVLGLCGTASMIFHCPPVVMRILSNICAWAPTIVLLIGFNYFCPDRSIADFYKKAFGGKISIVTLVASAILTLGATIITVFVLSLIQGKAFGEYWNLGYYPFWASFLFSITTGPTGEESGWRGYLRPYLNAKYSFFSASVIHGVIWAFWHTILWFVDSDYMGIQMIPYVLSNVIVMTGLCFIMNFFMEKNDNLIYGIVIHFCFNFLYCFLQVDIWFYVILSAIYIVIITLICWKKKQMQYSIKT